MTPSTQNTVANAHVVQPLYTLKQALRVLGIITPGAVRAYTIDRELILLDVGRIYRTLMKHHHVDHGGNPDHHRHLTLAYERIKHLCRPLTLPDSSQPRKTLRRWSKERREKQEKGRLPGRKHAKGA